MFYSNDNATFFAFLSVPYTIFTQQTLVSFDFPQPRSLQLSHFLGNTIQVSINTILMKCFSLIFSIILKLIWKTEAIDNFILANPER